MQDIPKVAGRDVHHLCLSVPGDSQRGALGARRASCVRQRPAPWGVLMEQATTSSEQENSCE
jgi:hypothetical protein